MIKQSENAMIRNANNPQTANRILKQVNEVRRSKQIRDQRYSWLVGGTVLLTMMIVMMVVEYQLNLFSHLLRFALTILSLTTAVVCGWTLWKRGNRANERLVSAARDIDVTYPAMEERVSTLTSCDQEQLNLKRRVHPAMLNRLIEETETLHQHADPKPIVSYRLFKFPLTCLAVATLVLLAMCVWDAPRTFVQIGRFCAPWANLSTTKITVVEADQVVARHEPIKLTASLSGRPVDEVEFFSKNIDGSDSSTTRLWPSAKDNSVASLRQSKAIESFDYQFRAGDGQTHWHRVTVADRPKIEDLTMRIVPPEYTGKSPQTFLRLPKKLRIVTGSRLEVSVKPKVDVRTARLVMGENDWLPLTPSSDGTYDGNLLLTLPVNFKVQLTELHGLVNHRPPHCHLQVVDDEAPKVHILKPTKTAVLLPDEELDIHFKATDDFGIQEMALRVSTQRRGADQPTVHEVPIPIDSNSDSRKIKGVVQLDLAQFNLKDGDSISYEIRASDNYRPVTKALEPIEGQKNLQPMDAVELTQAKALPMPHNSTSDKGDLERSQLASANVKESPQTVDSSSAQKPTTPAAALSTKSSAAKPAERRDSAPRDAVVQSKPTPSSEKNLDQTQAEQTAAASSNDSAMRENKIQSAIAQGDMNAKDAKSLERPQSAGGDPVENPDSSAGSNVSIASAVAKASSSSPADANASSNKTDPANPLQPSSSSATSKQKLAAKDAPQPDSADEGNEPTQSTADPVDMTMPSLDIAGQSSSSGQQQIKVDQYAGGFTSEHRYKLELTVSPTLDLLKRSLLTAGDNAKDVMSDPADNRATKTALSDAAGELKTASNAVSMLNEKTRNTPYAFVGLRLESIRAADVEPAEKNLRKSITAADEPRLQHTRIAWNHISRALGSLEKLEGQYEQVRRSLKRADDILKFKKMHRVFVDNALAMLNPEQFSINGQSRKGVEYDLDEEYLERLKEVLQMRQDMMAELARIMDDDPKLLRRYMNSMNQRTFSVRDQLSLIATDQNELSQQILLWSDAVKDPVALALHRKEKMGAHLAQIEELANQFADVQDQFISWLPLEKDAEKGATGGVVENFKTTGSALTEIVADVERILLAEVAQPDTNRQIEPLLSKATEVEKRLASVVQSLRQLNRESTTREIVNNAARRVTDLVKIGRELQRWVGKLELLKDGLVHEVYSVEQEDQRDQLLQYSVKIASLESQLLAAMQNQDGELPAGVAEQTQLLQTFLDVDIPAAQLLAAQTLIDADTKLAKPQQESIVETFEEAEQTFDRILQAIADELDKIPPPDPIASLLQDPTLDEILAQLENEQDFLEQLGLSRRPSNLQTMGYFSRMSRGMGSSMRRLSNMAYRNALKRANIKNLTGKPKRAKENERWNLLASELGEDMLQGDNRIPPERYRSAIEHYFEQISKLKNDQETK